jgi:1-acyl-sn-glycerol-3-phosphate acyltransferase
VSDPISASVDLDALDPDLERNDLWAIAHRRVTGRYPIDEYGIDPDLLHLVRRLARLRWRVVLDGAEHLPEVGPALLVHNRRLGVSEAAVLGLAIHRATGRPQRWLGGVGRGPFAHLARQMGGVPSDPADVRSLLHAGELVSVPLSREPVHRFHVPAVPRGPVQVALELGVPLVAVAVAGSELGRGWHVRVAPPIATRRRRATADPEELAEALRAALADELTQSRRGIDGRGGGRARAAETRSRRPTQA